MDELQNENPKNPRVEKSKNVFEPGTIPPWKLKKLEDLQKKQSKKKLNDLDKYLIFAFTSLILFTIAVLIIYIFVHDEPAVLVGCFFGAFGGEILMCALIKRLKLRKEMKDKGGGDFG